MSHSKRNTSRAVFTSHERALAQAHWNDSSARLNRDSFLPFGSCGLCLEIARDPVSCQKGDLFCRECALANILAQKKELKRVEKSRQDAEHEVAQKAALEDEEERARAVHDFERTQAGMAVIGKTKPASEELHGAPQPVGKELVVANPKNDGGGIKRKFTFDEDDVDRNTREDKAKARKAIEDEKAAKPSLPSFWTPSLTPDIHDSKLGVPTKKGKTAPTCPASTDDSPHTISMQKLITVHFDEQVETSTEDKRRTCPSCRKALTNASAPVMAKHCGHVLCQKCAKQFLIPLGKQQNSEQDEIIACYVCDEPVAVNATSEHRAKSSLPVGLVALRSEGTGFSARGTSTVAKTGIAFQC